MQSPYLADEPLVPQGRGPVPGVTEIGEAQPRPGPGPPDFQLHALPAAVCRCPNAITLTFVFPWG